MVQGQRESPLKYSSRSSSTSYGNWRTWWGRWPCCTCLCHSLSCRGSWWEVREEEGRVGAAALVEDDRSWRGDDHEGECRVLQWWRRSSYSRSVAGAGSERFHFILLAGKTDIVQFPRSKKASNKINAKIILGKIVTELLVVVRSRCQLREGLHWIVQSLPRRL